MERIKITSHMNHVTRARFWRVSGGGFDAAFFNSFGAAVASAERRSSRLARALWEGP